MTLSMPLKLVMTDIGLIDKQHLNIQYGESRQKNRISTSGNNKKMRQNKKKVKSNKKLIMS